MLGSTVWVTMETKATNLKTNSRDQLEQMNKCQLLLKHASIVQTF